MRNYIHINLCLSLIIAQLVFVVGVDRTGNEVHIFALSTGGYSGKYNHCIAYV